MVVQAVSNAIGPRTRIRAKRATVVENILWCIWWSVFLALCLGLFGCAAVQRSYFDLGAGIEAGDTIGEDPVAVWRYALPLNESETWVAEYDHISSYREDRVGINRLNLFSRIYVREMN